MLSNMANSLIEHKRITTTVAKAKALRGFVEPLITKSKTDNTHSRRIVFKSLKDKNTVSELFREIAPKIAERPGGYIRIIKTGFRLGDSAEMCMVELVDFNDLYNPNEKQGGGKKRRRRRKKSSDSSAASDQGLQSAASTAEGVQTEEKPSEETKADSSKSVSSKSETPKTEASKAESDSKDNDSGQAENTDENKDEKK